MAQTAPPTGPSILFSSDPERSEGPAIARGDWSFPGGKADSSRSLTRAQPKGLRTTTRVVCTYCENTLISYKSKPYIIGGCAHLVQA